MTACAVALRAAGEGRTVRLDAHDRDGLAAIFGVHGDGPVTPRLLLGSDDGQNFDLVVHDGKLAEKEAGSCGPLCFTAGGSTGGFASSA